MFLLFCRIIAQMTSFLGTHTHSSEVGLKGADPIFSVTRLNYAVTSVFPAVTRGKDWVSGLGAPVTAGSRVSELPCGLGLGSRVQALRPALGVNTLPRAVSLAEALQASARNWGVGCSSPHPAVQQVS